MGRKPISYPLETRIGRLVVKSEPFKKPKARNLFITCQCDCGNVQDIPSTDLKNNVVYRCGECGHRANKVKIEIGNTYGKWTVLEETVDSKGRMAWKCECACGGKATMLGAKLLGDRSYQCCKCASEGRKTGVDGSLYGKVIAGADARNIPVEVSWAYLKAIIE